MSIPSSPPSPHEGLPSRAELIAILAMLYATLAFSIDAMLPALPELSDTLSPDAPNRVQMVVTMFLLGLGLGTLVTGPLSDRFGRRPVVLGGALLYTLSSLIAIFADSLIFLLLARLVQGVGAAGPRVVALAIIRDLFSGRAMAQIVSFVMMLFTVIPALAPSIGAVLIHFGGWRSIFLAFALFSALSALWFCLRLPETLPPARRRPFRMTTIRAALVETLSHPTVRLSIAAQCFCYGILFSTISSIQPIYEISFDRAASFPLWFGAVAVVAISSSYLNALLVVRLGMRFLIRVVLNVQIVASGLLLLLVLSGLQGNALFAAFVVWQMLLFYQQGMTLGNLNAIGMEPLGHIAGMAASVIGAVSTVIGVALAVPVGLMFDGTPLPLALGVLAFSAIARGLMQALGRAERRMAS